MRIHCKRCITGTLLTDWCDESYDGSYGQYCINCGYRPGTTLIVSQPKWDMNMASVRIDTADLYISGMNIEEIADYLNIGHSTVYHRLKAAGISIKHGDKNA